MADNEQKKYFEFLDIPDGNGGTERWYATDEEAQAAIALLNPASVEAKANKVSGATSGHLAGLDSNGDLTDSGKAPSDFASSSIENLIPTQATELNKLADQNFVNSSVATSTATYRGNYNLVSDLNLTVSATNAQIATALGTTIATADNNDYCFVQVPTSDSKPTEIRKIVRFKHNGTAWEYEYELNNSGFTAAQWAALNSNITSGLVDKLSALPTNAELTTLLSGKASTTYVDDRTIIPVDLSTLTPSSTFVKRNGLAINGVIYVATQNTSNFPVQLAVQGSDFVTHTLNGKTAYVVLNNTVNSDWELWVDVSEDFQIAQKQDKLTFDTTPKSGSTNPVTSNGIKAAIDSAVSDVNTTINSVCTKTKIIGTSDVGSKVSGWVELDPEVDLHVWPDAATSSVNLNIGSSEWRIYKVLVNANSGKILIISLTYGMYYKTITTSTAGWYTCEIMAKEPGDFVVIRDWEKVYHNGD